MVLDHLMLKYRTRKFKPSGYVRLFPIAHKATPLGTGPGLSRFSSKIGNFTTLYAARSLSTALAETVIRDRFEGGGERVLFSDELRAHCATAISAKSALSLLDLRSDGCFQLGVSTDIASAKKWDEARELAQYIHDETLLDGILYSSRLTGENCVALFERAVKTNLSASKAKDLYLLPSLPNALNALNTKLKY